MSRRAALVAAALLLGAGCAARRAPPPAPAPAASPAPSTPRIAPGTVTLGTSVRGVPIEMHVFGTGPDVTLVFAAIHGDEPAAAFVGRKLLEQFQADAALAIGRTVAVIPVANPDGLATGTRTNANGVDCNRNFPASNWKRQPGFLRSNPGARPASEPETLAVMKAVARVKPAKILSIHSGLRCNNFDGPAEDLAKLLAQHNHYPVAGSVGYATPGSLGSWAGVDLGLPVVTLELPRSNNGPRAWEENRQGILAVIAAPVKDLTRPRTVVQK